jgi:hypothetical protein
MEGNIGRWGLLGEGWSIRVTHIWNKNYPGFTRHRTHKTHRRRLSKANKTRQRIEAISHWVLLAKSTNKIRDPWQNLNELWSKTGFESHPKMKAWKYFEFGYLWGNYCTYKSLVFNLRALFSRKTSDDTICTVTSRKIHPELSVPLFSVEFADWTRRIDRRQGHSALQ